MNLAMCVALYAACCKELALPLVFPGMHGSLYCPARIGSHSLVFIQALSASKSTSTGTECCAPCPACSCLPALGDCSRRNVMQVTSGLPSPLHSIVSTLLQPHLPLPPGPYFSTHNTCMFIGSKTSWVSQTEASSAPLIATFMEWLAISTSPATQNEVTCPASLPMCSYLLMCSAWSRALKMAVFACCYMKRDAMAGNAHTQRIHHHCPYVYTASRRLIALTGMHFPGPRYGHRSQHILGSSIRGLETPPWTFPSSLSIRHASSD